MSLPPLRPAACLLLLLLASASLCLAHPVPDVPVRADFAQDGSWILQVEVDPRCFEPDPNVALSVLNSDLGRYAEEKKEKLKAQARDYIRQVIEIVLDPPVPLDPAFQFEFTTHDNVPLKAPEDIVVLTGTWKTRVPEGTTGYSIKALPAGTLSVLFQNTALGNRLDRLQILFPGETSFVLDLKTYKPRTLAPPVITADDGGICVSCYEATPQQTLPVVVVSVATVFLFLWWKRKRAA